MISQNSSAEVEINKPITAIIILTVAFVVIFLFVIPQYQELEVMQTDLVQKEAKSEGQSTYYAKMLKLLREVEDNKDALGKIDNALPSDFSFASVVYFLQEKGSQAGLVVKSVTFSQVLQTGKQLASVASSKEVKSIMFTVDLSGDYQSFKKFLSSLEESARLFEVEDIFLAPLSQFSLTSGNRKQNQIKMYNFKLNLKTHAY